MSETTLPRDGDNQFAAGLTVEEVTPTERAPRGAHTLSEASKAAIRATVNAARVHHPITREPLTGAETIAYSGKLNDPDGGFYNPLTRERLDALDACGNLFVEAAAAKSEALATGLVARAKQSPVFEADAVADRLGRRAFGSEQAANLLAGAMLIPGVSEKMQGILTEMAAHDDPSSININYLNGVLPPPKMEEAPLPDSPEPAQPENAAAPDASA